MYGENRQWNHGAIGGAALGAFDAAEVTMKEQAHQAQMARGLPQQIRQPEVVAEMEELSRAADILTTVVGNLVERLQPVLSQCGNGVSTEAQKTSPPEPVLCGVAGMIWSRRRQIDFARAQLERTVSELEI